MSLTDRLRDIGRRTVSRRAVRGQLVRVDQPAPASSPQLALPAPEWPVCPRCRTRHEPRPLPGRGGGQGGLSAYRDTIVLPDPDRPAPLGRGAADERPLELRRFRPWTGL